MRIKDELVEYKEVRIVDESCDENNDLSDKCHRMNRDSSREFFYRVRRRQ